MATPCSRQETDHEIVLLRCALSIIYTRSWSDPSLRDSTRDTGIDIFHEQNNPSPRLSDKLNIAALPVLMATNTK